MHVAVVVNEDLDRAGQLSPGQAVRFQLLISDSVSLLPLTNFRLGVVVLLVPGYVPVGPIAVWLHSLDWSIQTYS